VNIKSYELKTAYVKNIAINLFQVAKKLNKVLRASQELEIKNFEVSNTGLNQTELA